MRKILLFIPFYNCEKQIPRVLKQIIEYQNLFTHILLVDNRSSDDSLAQAQNFIFKNSMTNITVIKNCFNYGLGGSHKVAFKFAVDNDFSHIIVLHGDDQGHLKDIAAILDQGNLSYDCILGARFHTDSSLEGYSFIRKLGNIVLNTFCSIPCRRQILDMGAGLNLYSTKILSDPRILMFPNDLTFNVFLIFHSCLSNHRMYFFPLSWREYDQVSNVRFLSQIKTILHLILKVNLNPASIYDSNQRKDYPYEIILEC